MLRKRHAELKLHVWQTHRQRLRQLLRTAGPLRRPSVHPGHASALLLHRELIVFSVVSTILRSWFVLPQRAAVAVVVRLDRPFSLQVRNTNSCKSRRDKTLLYSHLFDTLFTSVSFEFHLFLICMAVGVLCVCVLADFMQIFLPHSASPAWALLMGESGSPFRPLLPPVFSTR